jgi:hypothetical protein
MLLTAARTGSGSGHACCLRLLHDSFYIRFEEETFMMESQRGAAHFAHIVVVALVPLLE